MFFGEFNEQSLDISWVNWYENEGFWKRFTCTKCFPLFQGLSSNMYDIGFSSENRWAKCEGMGSKLSQHQLNWNSRNSKTAFYHCLSTNLFTTSDPPNIRIPILQIFVFVIEGGQENIFLLVQKMFSTTFKLRVLHFWSPLLNCDLASNSLFTDIDQFEFDVFWFFIDNQYGVFQKWQLLHQMFVASCFV